VPVLIAAGYYAIKNPDDFDPSLKPLRADSLMWSVRVESTSNSRRTIGVGSSMRDLFGEDILGYVILVVVILVLVFGTKRNSDGNINNVFSNAASVKQ
jgi:hypothetical protein